MSSWAHLGGVEPMTSSLFGIAQEDGSTRDNVAQIVTGFDSFPPPLLHACNYTDGIS